MQHRRSRYSKLRCNLSNNLIQRNIQCKLGLCLSRHLTSFQLWRSAGITTAFQLKALTAAALAGSILTLIGSFVAMHIKYPSLSWFKYKFKSLAIHHLSLLLGLGSLSWCGHQVHVSVPVHLMLDASIDPQYIPSPQQLIQLSLGAD